MAVEWARRTRYAKTCGDRKILHSEVSLLDRKIEMQDIDMNNEVYVTVHSGTIDHSM